MRLRHIEIFHAVMRTGSVSGAAELLHLSQSAASKALARAEQSLGLRLFDRVRGRLVSTREAQQLFAQTGLLFAQAETVHRLARNLSRRPGGLLRIGCLPSLGIGLIPAAIQHFRPRCPEVSIDIMTSNGVELAERTLSQDIDVAIGFALAQNGRLKPTRLGTARTVHLEAAEGHGGEPAVELATLDRSRWISIGGSDPLAERILEAWPAQQAPEPVPASETRTYSVACALARQGLGFALVDEFTASAMGHGMHVRPVLPEVTVEVVALQDSTAQGSEALAQFLVSVVAKLQGGMAWKPFQKE